MSCKLANLTRVLAVVCAGAALCGCATSAIDESSLFVDPAAFALYDCKQLASVRESYAKRVEELRGLMAKAETGAGGSVIAEIAYRPDYLSAQARLKSANDAWRRERCDSAVQAADPSLARPAPGADPSAGRSRSRVY